MPNLKEVRNRIVSVGSTMQITSAMKMVSAAKLKRAQDAVVQMRPYANKLKEILENVSASVDASENKFARKGAVKSVLIVPISSNRGLAGAFNSSIIKKTWTIINELKDMSITVIPVGKKAYDVFNRTQYNIHGSDIPDHGNDLFNKLTFENVAPFADSIINAYADKQFDKVIIVYNQFKNAAVQIPTEEQLLPLEAPKADTTKKKADYDFEPGTEYIINELIPRSIRTQFYKALLDSFASEHGARMTAMHKATDNATAMQKELKITYNKARQASITKEILEIVSGAEALNG
ncbi:MAG: ATP synthase F1 subunit gamma [Bacteroidia bacterium]|nr:ATP synthase F1 subunit gamma [Sphingobacteriaceae bacterium]MBP9069877.1 ATP synthase F1 subunit gamma [Bacteroidia bacterium]